MTCTGCGSRVAELSILKVFRVRVGGSVRVIEDILLSECNGGSKSKNGRALYRKRSERGQGREIINKKVQVLTKVSKNRAL